MNTSKAYKYQPLNTSSEKYLKTSSCHRASLVEEVAAAISINGIAKAVMMVTPANLEHFAYGFAASEGLISGPEDVRDIIIDTATEHGPITQLNIDIMLSPRMFNRFKQAQQVRLGASGCGLCGSESLAQAFPELSPLPTCAELDPMSLVNMRQLFAQQQILGQQSGAIHGALLLDDRAQPIVCMEDIGRHNALDKIIGFALAKQRNLHNHSVVMSSRCSTELVQKAIKAKLSRLIHLASPSAQAVHMAQYYGLTLVHLPKQDSPRLYAPIDHIKDAYHD